MENEYSHKVILILDRGKTFAKSGSSTISASIKDVAGDPKSERTLATKERNLWSWCMEGSLEFYRIVSDLFWNNDKLVRVALADAVGRMLQPSWAERLDSPENMRKTLMAACRARAADHDEDSSASRAAFIVAAEALTQRSHRQRQEAITIAERNVKDTTQPSIETKLFGPRNVEKLKNSGGFLHFSSFASLTELNAFLHDLAEVIEARNKIVTNLGDDDLIPIDVVEIFIVNILPAGAKHGFESKPRFKVTDLLYASVICTLTDNIISAVHQVCVSMYDLVSTTVCNIPMREEAKQAHSVQYNVEILHARSAHLELDRHKVSEVVMSASSDAGSQTQTCNLNWVTASMKTQWDAFPRCISTCPVTPSAFNSRQSVCMSSFLLAGRTVLLEITKKGLAEKFKPNCNDKLISHSLVSHQGRLYMHSFPIAPFAPSERLQAARKANLPVEAKKRTPLPEIVSKHGTPRFTEFCHLVRQCMLRTKVKAGISGIDAKVAENKCGQPIRHILRLTRHWPLYREDSFIYRNPKLLDPLWNKIRNLELSTIDIDECKQVIATLCALKDSKEPLCADEALSTCRLLKRKQCTRDEQYKIALVDFARHLSNYVNHSQSHLELFNFYMQLTKLDKTLKISVQDVLTSTISRFPTQRNSQKTKAKKVGEKSKKSSRTSSPVAKKARKPEFLWKPGEKINIYEFLRGEEDRKMAVHTKEFEGRKEFGDKIAQLYRGIDFSSAPARGEVL